jgi:hypothetical protein
MSARTSVRKFIAQMEAVASEFDDVELIVDYDDRQHDSGRLRLERRNSFEPLATLQFSFEQAATGKAWIEIPWETQQSRSARSELTRLADHYTNFSLEDLDEVLAFIRREVETAGATKAHGTD